MQFNSSDSLVVGGGTEEAGIGGKDRFGPLRYLSRCFVQSEFVEEACVSFGLTPSNPTFATGIHF